MDAKLKTEIIEKVEKAIAHAQGGVGFTVDHAAVRQEDDWWYVVVTPSDPTMRSFDYANRLTEIEEDLNQNQNLKVLLVPALVED